MSITPGLEVKSKLLEIERKFKSYSEEWEPFVSLVRSKGPHMELEVEGPDTYYQNETNVIRWRYGSDISELTIKSRYSESSSLVREELEINLSDNSHRSTIAFLRGLGFKKMFRIHKKCHIFWVKNDLGEACLVIYVVSKKGTEDRYFIEIEANKGDSIADSKNLIRFWEKELGLPAHRRLNETLFEIYSGQVTQMIRKEDGCVCIKCGINKPSTDFYASWLKKSGSKCKECCSEENLSAEGLAQTCKRNKERRKTDLSFKLKTQIRNRINHAVKVKKPGSAVTGLGCTIEDLKSHLKSKFYISSSTGKYMDWADWGWGPGKWQIDHIKPLSHFDLTNRLQFLEACHFTNLQPLWFEDHVIKSASERKIK